MFTTNLPKCIKFAGQFCKSRKSLKRYACACFGNFMSRLLEVSGRPQAGLAQNVFIAKVAQTLRLCMFRWFALRSSGRSRCERLIAKVPQTLRLCMLLWVPRTRRGSYGWHRATSRKSSLWKNAAQWTQWLTDCANWVSSMTDCANSTNSMTHQTNWTAWLTNFIIRTNRFMNLLNWMKKSEQIHRHHD